MPTGNMNKDWDQEDPNKEIPPHETKVMDDMAIESIPRHNSVPDDDLAKDDIKKVEDVSSAEKDQA